MNRFGGKVALITGTSGGIGAATARRLASEGAKVVLADINIEGAQKTADQVRAEGGEALAHFLDLAEEESIKALIDAAIRTYGRIDVLFNNAAETRTATMVKDAAIEFMDADLWDSVFRINTRGTMLMIKHTLPHMVRQGGGSIINTSSGASLRADLFPPRLCGVEGRGERPDRVCRGAIRKKGHSLQCRFARTGGDGRIRRKGRRITSRCTRRIT